MTERHKTKCPDCGCIETWATREEAEHYLTLGCYQCGGHETQHLGRVIDG